MVMGARVAKAKANDDHRLITTKELTDKTGLNERWIRRARDKYGMPFVKLGGLVRFRWNDVERWLGEREYNEV